MLNKFLSSEFCILHVTCCMLASKQHLKEFTIKEDQLHMVEEYLSLSNESGVSRSFTVSN